MARRGLPLISLLTLFGLAAWAGGAAPNRIPLAWSPTPAQIDRWRKAEEGRILPVCVSLKTALPPKAGDCALRVVSVAWLPGASPTPSAAPASLGRRGTWRGIPFQEVLVHPVGPAVPGSQPSILGRLEVEVVFARGAQAASSSQSRGSALLPESTLFTNPGQVSKSAPSPTTPAGPAKAGPPPAPAFRISVSRDGIYRLDYSYLKAHGFDPAGLAADSLHLTCRGIEVPLTLKGPANKTFGKKNSVVFYGQKLSIHDRPVFQGGDFTDTNVYWLYSDASPGLRMSVVKSKGSGGSPPPRSFTDTVHAEVNNLYAVVAHFRPNGDNWFWGPALIAAAGSPSPPYDYTVALPHATGGPASVTSVLAGINDSDHAVCLTLNGHTPDDNECPANWSGHVIQGTTWSFSAAAVAGDNTLELALPGFPSHLDLQYLDAFDVSYDRTFDADEGALRFTVPAADSRYKSSGYASAPIILDLSSRDEGTGLYLPVLLKGATFSGSKVTFHLGASAGTATRTVALSSSPLQPDDALVSSAPDLSDPSLGADLLVITHPDFHPQGQDPEWEAYVSRRGQNLQVAVVDIQDVYDNFSYGIFDPTAVRSFLTATAAHWQKVPQYVLLIGDATYDYKNYKADPTLRNWVPTMMFEDTGDFNYVGQYPSDSWYADVDANGYPDMAVGRLTARSYDELAGVLGKIAAYEDVAQVGDWGYRTLYVAGDITEPWEQEFETFNDHLCATYTQSPRICVKVYFQEPPFNGTDADACAAAIRQNWACSLVHYMGHAGFRSWGKNHAIFTSYPSRNCGSGTCADSDVDLLPAITSSSAPLPFVLNSACYVSAFDEVGQAGQPATPVLMEALMAKPDGGSIASVGFSTIAFTDEEESFNGTIFSQIFQPPGVRIAGDLVELGRFSLPSSDERSVFGAVLLGDPTQVLRIP